MAIVAAKSTRIVAQGEILGILPGADGAFVIVDAQRIIAERIFEFENHRGILPGPFETENLDTRPVAVAHPGGDVLAQSLDAGGIGWPYAGIDAIAFEGSALSEEAALRQRISAPLKSTNTLAAIARFWRV